MSVLERVFFFHQETHKGAFPNARTLSNHFEMSVATARRDISYLRDRLGAPLAFDPIKNGYYYQEGFHLPFEESPRIVFLLAMLSKLAEEAGLGELQEVRQLEERLAAMLSADYATVIDSLHCLWIEVESIDHRIFETIIEAIIKKRQLTLRYRPIGGTVSEREVAPLRIINYQGRWYFYGFCSLRRDNRLFHLARVQHAELSEEKTPETLVFDRHSLEASFGIFDGEPRYTAEILFTSTAAELVQHQRWHRDQETVIDDRGVLLRLPVNDDRELVMKILQYGASAKVLSPPELAARVKGEIKAMAENYCS